MTDEGSDLTGVTDQWNIRWIRRLMMGVIDERRYYEWVTDKEIDQRRYRLMKGIDEGSD